MNRFIKNLVGAALIFGVLVLSWSALRYANSYSRSVDFGSSRAFTVIGEGEAIALPNIAEITISIISKDENQDLKKLQEENSESANAIIAFLKKEGLDQKDITTANYSINPQYEYCVPKNGACPSPKISGYEIRQNLLTKIRDFSKIGVILKGAVERGANSVSELSFKLDASEKEKIQGQAREKAIENGKEKARAVAKAAGIKVGKLISVDENFSGFYAATDFEALRSEAPIIEPGAQKISASVILRYEIR